MSGTLPSIGEGAVRFSHAGIGQGHAAFEKHNHDGVELVRVRQGRCGSDFFQEKNLIHAHLEASTGGWFVIPPRTWHNQINYEETITDYVVFDAQESFFNSSLRILYPNDALCDAWLGSIVQLDDELQFEQCQGLLYALLDRLKRSEKQNKNELLYPPPLSRMLLYIERNLANSELSLGLIAADAMISVSYLKKLFAQHLQCAPMAYIRDMRMVRARQLLRNRHLFVEEVASQCGYSSSGYFARVFRQHHNVSPEEFRYYLDNGTPMVPDRTPRFV